MPVTAYSCICMHIKYILLAYLCILFAYCLHILCIFQHICAYLCIFMHIIAYSLHIKYIFLAYLCIFPAYIMHILTYLGIFSVYFLHICSTLAYLMPLWSFHNADWNLSFSLFFVSLTAFFLQLTFAFFLFRHVADMALTSMCTCVQIKLLQHVAQPLACARQLARIFIWSYLRLRIRDKVSCHACPFMRVSSIPCVSVHLRGRG